MRPPMPAEPKKPETLDDVARSLARVLARRGAEPRPVPSASDEHRAWAFIRRALAASGAGT